jgi:hypothetical protein
MPNEVIAGSAVLGEYWKRRRPVERIWRNPPLTVDCGFPPENSGRALRQLIEKFGTERVRAAGLASRSRNGRWIWSRGLRKPDNVLVAVRDAREANPFEILTPDGPLLGDVASLNAILRDFRTMAWTASSDFRVFVCGSTVQVPLFRSLMLAAVPWNGLLDLTTTQLWELSAELGWEAGESAIGADPINLVLVNQNDITREAREVNDIRRLAEFLAITETHQGGDMKNTSVWLPTEPELEKISFCVHRGDRVSAREAVLESVDCSSYVVAAYADPRFNPRYKPDNYIDAIAEICRSSGQLSGIPGGGDAIAVDQAAFNAIVDRDLVNPVIAKALENPDPLRRSMGVLLGESLRSMHRQTPGVVRDVEALAAKLDDAQRQKQLRDQLKQRDRQMANVMRITKAMKK